MVADELELKKYTDKFSMTKCESFTRKIFFLEAHEIFVIFYKQSRSAEISLFFILFYHGNYNVTNTMGNHLLRYKTTLRQVFLRHPMKKAISHAGTFENIVCNLQSTFLNKHSHKNLPYQQNELQFSCVCQGKNQVENFGVKMCGCDRQHWNE